MKDLSLMTVKELQAKLIDLGMPEEDALVFKTKAPMISAINTLSASKAVEETEEVKKVASIEEKPNPSEDREVNRRWKSKAEAMRDKLLAQEKVSILIPVDPTEKAGVVEWRTDKYGQPYQVHLSGAIESVQLNGYKFLIEKGKYTQVPRQIAEVISKSQQQTLEAGSDIRIDRIDPNTGKPVAESL